MKKVFGIVSALAVMGLAATAHAAVLPGLHGAMALAAPATPEPGTLGILATGAVMLLRRRRH
jgi:hypothetical protein